MEFLKRRRFMGAAAGVVAGLAVPPRHLTAQQSQAFDIRRKSMLFETSSPRARVVKLLHLSDYVLTLFQDEGQRQFGAAVYSFDGNRLWQYPLPPAFAYSTISTGDGGKAVLLHAFNLRLAEKQIMASVLLGLDPQTGASEIVYNFGATSSRYFAAGDGALIGMADGAMQLWTGGRNLSLSWTIPYPSLLRRDGGHFSLNVEPVQKDLLALVAGNGSRLEILSLSKAVITEHAITSPEIASARGSAQLYRARTGVSDSVELPLIPVTGTDRSGIVYGLIYPYPVGAPAPILALSTAGKVTHVGSYHLPTASSGLGRPCKLLPGASEFGVAFAGGAVAWYAS